MDHRQVGDVVAGLRETLATMAAGLDWPSVSPGAEDVRLVDMPAFGENPGRLRMRVYAPSTLAPRPALVVVLHGCTQSADAFASGTGWLSLAERYGFVVLCPEQTRANNPNLCFNWFEGEDSRRGGGEAASIRAMIGRAVADHGVATSRVYITGLSAGGAMANVMLATYPEVFAGGAIIAGVPYGAASNMAEAFGAMRGGSSRRPTAWGDVVRNASGHSGPWPVVSIWQGGADHTVKPGVADELVHQWTQAQGLGAVRPQATATTTSTLERTVWRRADGATAVELNRIAVMGHGAPIAAAGPDGCGAAGPFLIEAGVSAALESARSWGLASTPLAPAAPFEPPSDLYDRSARPKPLEATLSLASTLEQGLASTISQALRRSGLLK